MAKKKAARKKTSKKKTSGKKVSRKKAAPKKTARKKTAGAKATKKAPATKAAKKPRAKLKSGTRSAARPSKKPVKKSLGRPRVTADARLDDVFQKDFGARKAFEFLNVETVRELEQFDPQQILDALTAPMAETVQRIRKTLAMNNRSLAEDREFALEFLGLLRSD